jgi:hypothetical protein
VILHDHSSTPQNSTLAGRWSGQLIDPEVAGAAELLRPDSCQKKRTAGADSQATKTGLRNGSVDGRQLSRFAGNQPASSRVTC